MPDDKDGLSNLIILVIHLTSTYAAISHETIHDGQLVGQPADNPKHIFTFNQDGPRHLNIDDKLTQLLRDVGSELHVTNLGHRREIVLCHTDDWSYDECRSISIRVNSALVKAQIQGVGIQNDRINDLCLCSESEASLMDVLASKCEIKTGDTFVLLYADKDFADVNTYTIGSETPLTLRGVGPQPAGRFPGSKHLNDKLQEHLRDLLKEEAYLEQGSTTIAELVAMSDRIDHIKNGFDYYAAPTRRYIPIPGLLDNTKKGFNRGNIVLPGSKISDIFKKYLGFIEMTIDDQIKGAIERGCSVENLIVIGEFARSPSLVTCLKELVKKYEHIQLLRPGQEATSFDARSNGAAYVALNKRQWYMRGRDQRAT